MIWQNHFFSLAIRSLSLQQIEFKSWGGHSFADGIWTYPEEVLHIFNLPFLKEMETNPKRKLHSTLLSNWRRRPLHTCITPWCLHIPTTLSKPALKKYSTPNIQLESKANTVFHSPKQLKRKIFVHLYNTLGTPSKPALKRYIHHRKRIQRVAKRLAESLRCLTYEARLRP